MTDSNWKTATRHTVTVALLPDGGGWDVTCTCGWRSGTMGLGDAWTTARRGLDDEGHKEYARRRTLEDAPDSLTASADGVI